MYKKTQVDLSIIIPHYNNVSLVEICIVSIIHTKYYSRCELIIVDDFSNKDNLQKIKKFIASYAIHVPIQVIEHHCNRGSASSRNTGARNARGRFLFFLDQDTELHPACITQILREIKTNMTFTTGQCILLRTDKKTVETCGHFMSYAGLPYEVYKPYSQIFGARSAALVVKKNVFNKVGGFDESYFFHSEETDLSWRIWRAGYSIKTINNAIVYHHGSETLSPKTRDLIFGEGVKNGMMTIIKNASIKQLISMLPLFILFWIMVGLYNSVKFDVRPIQSIIGACIWNGKNLNNTINKRRYYKQKFHGAFIDSVILYGPFKFSTHLNRGITWLNSL